MEKGKQSQELLPPDIHASIHLGASSVSMLVIDSSFDQQSEPLEFLEQPLPLARDIFSKGAVSRPTIERAAEIIRGYLETLSELGADSSHLTRAVATNILAEASNLDIILNRLSVATGLPIEVLDDGEMTRLIYLKTQRRLGEIPLMKRKPTLVAHVGPGNTRALLFSKGRIIANASYRLGTHRTAEAIETSFTEGPAQLRLIREHASGPISRLVHDFRETEIEEIVLIGYEIQLLAPFLNKGRKATTQLASLNALCEEASLLPDDQRAAAYQLDFHTAEALLPALQINASIAESFGIKNVHIPASDYERGLLHDLPASSKLTREFETEVVRSATNLAAKYQVHSGHSQHVAFLSGRLFEETRDLHQLPDQDGLLLHVAAILHECGGFVSPHTHHKHSQYLILNSDIFGLSEVERTIVALIARYHRMSPPKPDHEVYSSLIHEDRLRVSKLAALLRVADSLERTHSSRVKNIKTKVKKNKLRLELEGVSDATAERLALQSKGDLFRNIYGLEVIIVE